MCLVLNYYLKHFYNRGGGEMSSFDFAVVDPYSILVEIIGCIYVVCVCVCVCVCSLYIVLCLCIVRVCV